MLELSLGCGELVPDPHLGDHPVGTHIGLHGELRHADWLRLDQSPAGGGVLLLLVEVGGEGQQRVVVRSVL